MAVTALSNGDKLGVKGPVSHTDVKPLGPGSIQTATGAECDGDKLGGEGPVDHTAAKPLGPGSVQTAMGAEWYMLDDGKWSNAEAKAGVPPLNSIAACHLEDAEHYHVLHNLFMAKSLFQWYVLNDDKWSNADAESGVPPLNSIAACHLEDAELYHVLHDYFMAKSLFQWQLCARLEFKPEICSLLLAGGTGWMTEQPAFMSRLYHENEEHKYWDKFIHGKHSGHPKPVALEQP
eukprot:gene19123-25734_t